MKKLAMVGLMLGVMITGTAHAVTKLPQYQTTWSFLTFIGNVQSDYSNDTGHEKQVVMPVGSHWTCTRDVVGITTNGGVSGSFTCLIIDSNRMVVSSLFVSEVCSAGQEDHNVSHAAIIEGNSVGTISLWVSCTTRRVP